MFDVIIPSPDSEDRYGLRSGAGCAVRVLAQGQRIYYEENRMGAVNIVTFADRVMIAASRLAERAPSHAQMLCLHPEHWLRVGSFDEQTGLIICDRPDELAAWLGAETLDVSQLMTSRPRDLVGRG